jgi:hypothetical protein
MMQVSLKNYFAFVAFKVHKNENFVGYDFESFTVSLIVMLKYEGFVKKIFDWPIMGELGLFRVVLRLRGIKIVFNLGPI